VARVSDLPGLRFRGLLSHAGHAYQAESEIDVAVIAAREAELLTTLAARVQALGVQVAEISVGATPTARFSAQQSGLTELRPGNYIYYDRTQVALGAATWDDCALTVLARVVSRPAADRVIFDCGSKTLTTDQARGVSDVRGYGVVFKSLDCSEPNASLLVERLSEEHATVRVTGDCDLQPGDLVRVLPNHACVVSNLVDSAWLVEGSAIAGRIEIAARGKIA
jgi:D-serine deaminase-like pyridoxal phosphate-dependent protein